MSNRNRGNREDAPNSQANSGSEENAQSKTLTEKDVAADLAGQPRPDNPSAEATAAQAAEAQATSDANGPDNTASISEVQSAAEQVGDAIKNLGSEIVENAQQAGAGLADAVSDAVEEAKEAVEEAFIWVSTRLGFPLMHPETKELIGKSGGAEKVANDGFVKAQIESGAFVQVDEPVSAAEKK